MKVAFVNIYQGAVDRGVETFVSEMSERIGADVIAGNQKPAKRWPIFWRAFIDPHGIQTFLNTLKFLPKIWKEKYDVVVPMNGGWQPALIRILTWLYGGKMVISGQSGLGWDDRNNLWSFPNSFVALTDYQKMWAKKANSFVRIDKIPNGVDLDKFKTEGDNIDFELPSPIILYVAALTGWKRQELAIQSVSQLDKGSLLLVGDGPDKNKLNALGNKLLPGRFKITSFPHEEMPKVYRVADVFTYPTVETESFGIATVEAMASGLPVVATNDPIRQEIVGDAGFFVDPKDTGAYSKYLKDALNKDWGNLPRKQAEKFSWDKIAKKYEKLFIELSK